VVAAPAASLSNPDEVQVLHVRPPVPSQSVARTRDWLVGLLEPGTGVLVLLLIVVTFSLSVANGRFLAAANLLGVVQNSASLALIASGMTFCLACGEVDLSVAGAMGLSSTVVARVLGAGMPWGAAVTLAVACGLAVGLVNGAATARVAGVARLFPSLLVTLASGAVVTGIAEALSPSNESVPITDPGFLASFGFSNSWAGNKALLYTVVALMAAYMILHHSRLGFAVFMVGASRSAAELVGISARRTKFQVMVVSGVLAGFAGVIEAGYLSSGSFSLGTSGSELDAIAAAVLGGTALFGGRGNIAATLIGVLALGALGDGVLLLQWPTSAQLMLTGGVVVFAMALRVTVHSVTDSLRRRGLRASVA
jgi:ribose transport system permease protein